MAFLILCAPFPLSAYSFHIHCLSLRQHCVGTLFPILTQKLNLEKAKLFMSVWTRKENFVAGCSALKLKFRDHSFPLKYTKVYPKVSGLSS
jgi:hypothetical protein